MYTTNYYYWDFSPFIFYSEIFQFRYYSLLFALGLLFVFINVSKLFSERKIKLESLLIKMVISTLIFSRIFHCLFYEFSYYSDNVLEILLPISLEEFSFKGYQGLSSHGGIFGFIFALFYFDNQTFTKKDKLRILDYTFYYSLVLMALIRIGNFFNSEIVGIECERFFCFVFPYYDLVPRYPAQLIEAFLYIIIFFIVRLIHKSNSIDRSGRLSLIIISYISVSRFFIEFIKVPNTVLNTGFLNVAQLLTLSMVLIALIIFSIFNTKLFK